jgi:PncC family amidohydrolase
MMKLAEISKQLVERLADRELRVVFAESCTGGLISAELAKIPGVSEWLCGSAVTYRCDTKVRWLGVGPEEIAKHTAVSREVASQMARGVLVRTPEASLSASVTGHLGPDAPEGFDGVVFVAVATRIANDHLTVEVSKNQLQTTERVERQAEAARLVLQLVLATLSP